MPKVRWRIFAGSLFAVAAAALGWALVYYLHMDWPGLLIVSGFLVWAFYRYVFWYKQVGRGIVVGSMEYPGAINFGIGLCVLGAGLFQLGYPGLEWSFMIAGLILTLLSGALLTWGIVEGPIYHDHWPI